MMQALIGLPETPIEIAKVQTALAQVSADCPYPFWIKILFAVKSTGWTCAELLARDWSMSAPHRYSQTAFDKVWQGANPFGGISIGTLFHYAKQVASQNGGAQSSGSSASGSMGGAGKLQPNGKLSTPTVPPPPRDYMLGKILVAGTVGVMAGAGAVAKTTTAIQFGINGALGKNLGTFEIGPFASALFLAEETQDERDRRFGALCSQLTAGERADVERFVYCEAAAGQDLRLTVLDNGNANETAQVERIIQVVRDHQVACGRRVGLIVIDHARLVMAGDPIASDQVTGLLRALNGTVTIPRDIRFWVPTSGQRYRLSRDTHNEWQRDSPRSTQCVTRQVHLRRCSGTLIARSDANWLRHKSPDRYRCRAPKANCFRHRH